MFASWNVQMKHGSSKIDKKTTILPVYEYVKKTKQNNVIGFKQSEFLQSLKLRSQAFIRSKFS